MTNTMDFKKFRLPLVVFYLVCVAQLFVLSESSTNGSIEILTYANIALAITSFLAIVFGRFNWSTYIIVSQLLSFWVIIYPFSTGEGVWSAKETAVLSGWTFVLYVFVIIAAWILRLSSLSIRKKFVVTGAQND